MSREAIREVEAHYDEAPLTEWERLERHPFEFIFTTHIMDQHIRPGERILDIGGGPGRYSLYYAEKGCDVTLVDLSSGNVQFALDKARARGLSIQAHAKNCLELEALELGLFDHVFLMGPLYHLTAEAERIQSVQLALKHVKHGGLLYVSFILQFAALIYDLKNGPGFLPRDLENPETAALIDCLAAGQNYVGPGFTQVCFHNQHQIEPFMNSFGLQKRHFFGQEGLCAPNEKQLLAFPPEERALWIETAKRLLERPELLSYSEHAMYVGEKP